MKICILYGGVSSERKISISSANSIYEAILDDYSIEMYDFTGDYVELLSKVEHVDLVFNALHGGDGENGVVQKFLEKNKIKFTGSNSLASKIAMNKIECKKICVENNIPTPKWDIYRKEKISLKLPYVVKPYDDGSSMGLSIVKDEKHTDDALIECLKISKNIVIEEYIDGREVTVSILNGKALPVVEILPKGDFYNYKCKYTKGECDYKVPAEMSLELSTLLQDYSIIKHVTTMANPKINPTIRTTI
jgi:D-alanine-D-alanine ligase